MQFTLNNIHKSYSNNGSGSTRVVLSDLNLEVEEGDSIAIVGPSGSGKTTILNLLGLMDKPDSGEIYFNGQDITSFDKNMELLFRNSEIGFVFQQHHLLPQCNVLENVLLPTLAKPTKDTESENRAEALLKDLGIWELRFQKPAEISLGEAQRVAIARALINQPSVLLADEPSGSLDEDNAAQFADILLNLNKKQGLTLIVVTHSTKLAQKMKKVYRFEKSRLVLASN